MDPKFQEIMAGLSVPADDKCLNAVQKLLTHCIEREEKMALSPNLNDNVRQFNTGRLAAMKDFDHVLFTLATKARK